MTLGLAKAGAEAGLVQMRTHAALRCHRLGYLKCSPSVRDQFLADLLIDLLQSFDDFLYVVLSSVGA